MFGPKQWNESSENFHNNSERFAFFRFMGSFGVFKVRINEWIIAVLLESSHKCNDIFQQVLTLVPKPTWLTNKNVLKADRSNRLWIAFVLVTFFMTNMQLNLTRLTKFRSIYPSNSNCCKVKKHVFVRTRVHVWFGCGVHGSSDHWRGLEPA